MVSSTTRHKITFMFVPLDPGFRLDLGVLVAGSFVDAHSDNTFDLISSLVTASPGNGDTTRPYVWRG